MDPKDIEGKQYFPEVLPLYQRYKDRPEYVEDKVTPGAEWVLKGEGLATQMYDGISVLFKDKKLYKKLGTNLTSPELQPASEEEKLMIDVFAKIPEIDRIDGTYEFCGPSIKNNSEDMLEHYFIPHSNKVFFDCPRGFHPLRHWLFNKDIEGIVWHHKDGRKVKLRKSDYGMKRRNW